MKDYYHILGIPGNATQADIKKAYYKLARQYHPDKNPDAAQNKRFLEINEAYETLGDKEKRQLYHYRWVNFKNNPRPVAPAATPRTSHASSGQPRPNARRASGPRRPYAAPTYASKPRYQYREYEPILRKVCKVALVMGLLLILDRVFTYQLPRETVLSYGSTTLAEARTLDKRFRITTPNTSFIVSEEVAKTLFVDVGNHIDVYRTPVLREEIRIRFLGNDFPVNGASIYHNFFFLVVLQTLFAVGGLYRRFSWSSRMNFGIMAGVAGALTLIVIWLTL